MLQTKNLFSIIATIIIGYPMYSNAMLVPKKTPAQSLQQHKAKLCSTKIRSYNHEHDEKIVTQIASQHLPQLMSDVTPNNKNELLQDAMNMLNDDATISKVYVIDGKPIGFINYYIGKPWIIANNLTIKSNAYINFLAIDDERRGKGAGTALLNDALDDLKNRSIHTITLITTDYDLENFYYKFGFNIVRSSKYTGCTQFMKRLQPHPIMQISSTIYEKIFTNKE